ncbi:MAG: PAS domain S-box protein [Flavipsychrobacter sp.]|nr:PAS domain S-box protein [Flavipsychrobacter sp.]
MENRNDIYQLMIEGIEDYAILLLDINGNIKTWNKGAEKIHGYKTQDVIGKNFRIFHTQDDQQKLLTEKLLKEAETNEKSIFEGWQVKQDGTFFWGDSIITAVYDHEIIVGFTKITHDLTETKKQIEFERNNLFALINNTNDLLWSVNTDYQLTACNSAFEGMVLYMSGKPIIKGHNVLAGGFSEEQLERWKGLYQRAFSGETFMITEYTESPVKFWSEISFYPIYEEDKIIGTACYSRNVTEKKLAEAEIRNSEDTRKLIMDSAMDAIICIDQSGVVTFWNPRAEKMFGWNAEEILGSCLVDMIIPPAHRKQHVEGMQHHLLSGDGPILNKLIDITALNRAGQEFPIELTIVPITQSGKLFFCAFIHDVTERKLAEKKIIKANRLYAFISQINQSIVHSESKRIVFKEACRIAVEFGKFKVAWIGIINEADKKINLIEESGMLPEDIGLFTNIPYKTNGPQDQVVQSGKHYVCNDIVGDPAFLHWRLIAWERKWSSCITLPIKKSDKVVATFNVISSETNFFDEEEISLLREATNDISFAIDVFEKEKHRKQMEANVIHSELRLKQAQAIAHFGSWELDFSTGIAEWSEEACRIYGMSLDESIHTFESWASFIHPEDLEYVMKITKESQATLSDTSYYHRIIRKDGCIRHIHSQAQFQFNNEGKPVGLYGVAHDITGIKETEDALQQSKENIRLIVDLIPQAIFAKDYKGRFVFVNKSFAELYGLTPKQIVYKTLAEAIPGKNEPEYFLKQDQEVILTGQTKIIPEAIFNDYTGAKRVFYLVKVPYTLPGRNEKAVLGIAMDITDQKLADAERNKMITDIIQRNKNLEQFSYIVSHNLRAPVANILGLSDLLQIAENSKEEEQMIMHELSTSVKKLDTVIQDLNYVLQVKHEINEKRETVKFALLLKDIQQSIENLLRSKDVKIIGDFSEVDEILTLKSYLYSIFFNLISNSIKYQRPGIPPVIEISSTKYGDNIQLIFKDNGLGIDLELRGGQVFGLYKRFHQHTEGKGMGLYMVKTQVETLGGKITIESEVNKGTTFKIVFGNT